MRIKTTLFILLVVACSSLFAKAVRPNIIVILADDQGWRDVGYNANPDRGLKTPNLDQMAREGIRFNRFYAASPNCAPTRAALLTGRHAMRVGVYNPGFCLRPDELTIAEVLKKAGYGTAQFGKWHLGPVKASSPVNPNKQGFDHYVANWNLFDLDPQLSVNGAPFEQFQGDGSEVLVDQALKYIDGVRDQNKPFFCYICFASPHDNHVPLPADKALYKNLPEEWANYFGEISGIDRAVGTLRSGLKSRGLDTTTLIWYTSDNGSFKPADTITGLRDYKGSTWDGGLRVPGLIVWPGMITKPIETEMHANTLDIFPTIIDLLGITVENRILDGVSLLPLIQGKDMTTRTKGTPIWRVNGQFVKNELKNKPLFTTEELTPMGKGKPMDCPEHPKPLVGNILGDAAWIEGKWKLHWKDNGKGQVYQLYDLMADSAESNDLAAQFPEVVKELAKKLSDWHVSQETSLTGAEYGTPPVIRIP